MEFFRARREKHYALNLTDPQPVKRDDIERSAARIATIGIFVLLLIAAFYFCRPVLLPVLAAMVVGATLAPLIKRASNYGVASWASAVVLISLLLGLAGVVVTLLAAPVAEWINKGPDVANTIRQKLYVLDRPLAALRELQNVLMPSSGPAVAVEPSQISMVTPVVAFITPAVIQAVLFLATLLFFLAGQGELRRYLASLFAGRDAKLRFIRISNDIEENLASYVAVMTAINVVLGTIVGIGAWLFGLPNPVVLGILTMLFNYIPYIGPACVALTLFAIGLVTFPTLSYALLPPACFVALTTVEGQIITPTILGHSLTLNPLAVLLSIAFWAWMWGPMGAFLAVPLLIVAQVIFEHVVPGDDAALPE